MDNRKSFFGFLSAIFIGPAVVVYLISSFLIATFDITLWQDGHRFLAVVVYVVLVLKLISSMPTVGTAEDEGAKGSTQKSDLIETETEVGLK